MFVAICSIKNVNELITELRGLAFHSQLHFPKGSGQGTGSGQGSLCVLIAFYCYNLSISGENHLLLDFGMP